MILADIGGWTVDIMRLDNRIPNAASCRSLELGMIRCLDEIAEREQFLLDLKTILQTELQNSSYPQTISQPQPAGSVDDDVLGFLRALQEEGEES